MGGDASCLPGVPGPVRRAALTLLVLGLVGVAGSGWLLYFTDWFPLVGGLLGLGGVFAWLAFLTNLISDDRKQQFQGEFDAKVLQRPVAIGWALALLAIALLGVAPFWSTLIVDTLGDDRSRLVEVRQLAKDRPAKGDPEARALLSPRSLKKLRLLTGWFDTESYYVKVAGLPGRIVEMPRAGRLTLSVPSDLTAGTVVLVRPALKFATAMRTRPLRLEVRVQDKVVATRQNYAGRPFWMGAERDVEIPASVRAAWRAEAAGNPGVLAGMLLDDPAAPFTPLPPGALVRVTMADKQGTVIFRGELTTPPSDVRAAFPLELILTSAR